MFDKKGQGAMEYLMTYGWAILVVMIVGLAMWQLGIFNLGASSVTSSGFTKIKPQLTSCKMTADGVFSCLFTNAAGSAIDATSYSVSVGGTICSSTSTTYQVGVGDNFLVGASSCPTGAAAEAYVADVTFTFSQNMVGETVTHTDFGTVRGPYEGI